jgi:hypothetical protein
MILLVVVLRLLLVVSSPQSTDAFHFLQLPVVVQKQQRGLQRASSLTTQHVAQSQLQTQRFFGSTLLFWSSTLALGASGTTTTDSAESGTTTTTPFTKACAAFEAAHYEDPRMITVTNNNNTTLPYSVHYHQRMVYWLQQLTTNTTFFGGGVDTTTTTTTVPLPPPSEALQLAVRCQHIRRWTQPRSAYPTGLAGYQQWRTKLQNYHAQQATDILLDCGYNTTMTQQVSNLLCKQNLPTSPDDSDVQLLEDVICVVFLENEYTQFVQDKVDQYTDEKLIRIVQKTWSKMSPRGHAAALSMANQLSEYGLQIVQQAISATSSTTGTTD